MKEEIQLAIKILKNGNISREKKTVEQFNSLSLTGTQWPKIWKEVKLPEVWALLIICPIYKKVNIMDCKIYRRILLLDILLLLQHTVKLTVY